jgi:GNAT superfamily N-acetyltransferase
VSTPVLEFRPLTHAGAQFAAEIATRDQPRRPMTAERLLRTWTNTEATSTVRRFEVLANESRLGWVSTVKFGGAIDEQAMTSVVVPGAGIDDYDAILAFATAQARDMGAKAILAEPWKSNTALVDALRRRGWEEKRRQRFWRLQLQPNAASLRRQLYKARERARSAGVAIATAAELGGEALYSKLYEINTAAHFDVPTTVAFEPDPYEVWLRWMDAPDVLPERVWVATYEGEPVGYSFLTYRVGLVDTGFTGVLREHRNKGIARALKLATLVQAIDLGVEAVETDNDSENEPILHLNEQIGYGEVDGQLQFHKALV